MQTISERRAILIYGQDPDLIETRRLLLEYGGFRVHIAASWEEFEKKLVQQSIHLVILCHSLSPEQCAHALELMRAEQPRAKDLALTATNSPCAELSDNVLDTRAGPACFLETVGRLLPADDVSEVLGT